MKEISEVLHRVPLFEKLGEDELYSIQGIGKTKSFHKDQVVFLEGDSYTGFYVVLDGSVKVFKLDADGNETILHLLHPYKSFAETPIFSDSDVYPACAQTTENSTLLCIPKSDFRRLMEGSSTLAIKISEAFAGRLMELNKKFGQLTVNVQARLARYIINEVGSDAAVQRSEPVLKLKLSKKDLASQLGIAAETLSRCLRKLKDEKIIRESSGRIFVISMKRLRELAR